MAERFDAIVIGTGQSDPHLPSGSPGGGRKTAIIERKLFGGTCVNVGCIPTKTLIASARAAYIARRGADFGVMIDQPIRIDMPRVKARKDEVVARSNLGVGKWLRSTPNVVVYEGHARFESPRTVGVNGALLEADAIFINVGARALIPRSAGTCRC
jgi:pyruvate/2-oxoglutarate dehydrogenase complex dihydrolipoamide dehydrogenase (E3) component